MIECQWQTQGRGGAHTLILIEIAIAIIYSKYIWEGAIYKPRLKFYLNDHDIHALTRVLNPEF